MVVYDVTSDQSFDSCAKWLERVKAQKPTPELPLPGETNIITIMYVCMLVHVFCCECWKLMESCKEKSVFVASAHCTYIELLLSSSSWHVCKN